MIKTYTCNNKENLLTFSLDGNLAIVDTGSHITLARDDLRELKICSRVFIPQSRLYHINTETLKRYLGFNFDVILGCDILKEFDVVLSRCYITFSSSYLYSCRSLIELTYYKGVPIIRLELEGFKKRFMIDTGSVYNYLSTKVYGDRCFEVIRDFQPLGGFFTSSLTKKRVRILDREIELSFGEPPSNKRLILQELGIDGILGVSLLEHYDLFFSFRRGLFSFIERKGG